MAQRVSALAAKLEKTGLKLVASSVDARAAKSVGAMAALLVVLWAACWVAW